jgi:hypothetical protein
MQNAVKHKVFFDSPPSKSKILNMQPQFIYGPSEYVKINCIKFSDFDIWIKVMSN